MNWIKVVPLSKLMGKMENVGLPCILVVKSPKGPEAIAQGTAVHRDSEADAIWDELACELNLWAVPVTR